jgi:pilus assembly protein CpaE
LDSHFLSGLLTKHKTKLELLGGVTQPEEWQAINVPSLERAINVAQNAFDVVLVDMGSQFSSEWSSILRMARMILVLAEANVPSLWALERRLVALKGWGVDPGRARIVINRWHKGDDEIVRGVQKESGYSIFANVPNDYRKTSQAVNLGTPIPDNHNNLLINRYRQIAEQILGIEPRTSEKKGTLSSLFSFSGRK